MDELLKFILMDVYTADQYSIRKRDTVIENAIFQIKKIAGQEYYNRFFAELERKPMHHHSDVFLAAKKAIH